MWREKKARRDVLEFAYAAHEFQDPWHGNVLWSGPVKYKPRERRKFTDTYAMPYNEHLLEFPETEKIELEGAISGNLLSMLGVPKNKSRPSTTGSFKSRNRMKTLQNLKSLRVKQATLQLQRNMIAASAEEQVSNFVQVETDLKCSYDNEKDERITPAAYITSIQNSPRAVSPHSTKVNFDLPVSRVSARNNASQDSFGSKKILSPLPKTSSFSRNNLAMQLADSNGNFMTKTVTSRPNTANNTVSFKPTVSEQAALLPTKHNRNITKTNKQRQITKLNKIAAEEKLKHTPFIVADLLGFGMEGMKATINVNSKK
jgi:hypothetical protein